MAVVLCPLHVHLNGTWATSSSNPAHYLARVQTVVLLGYWLLWWTTWHRRTYSHPLAHWTHNIIGVDRTVIYDKYISIR